MLVSAWAWALASHFKVVHQSASCDGQGTVRRVILYAERSYFPFSILNYKQTGNRIGSHYPDDNIAQDLIHRHIQNVTLGNHNRSTTLKQSVID